MKKYLMLTVVIVLMALVTTAQAEVRAGSFSVTPVIGGYLFERNQGYRNGLTAGLRAGYNFTDNIGMEGFFHWIQSEYEGIEGTNTNNVYFAGIEGLYHFRPGKSIVPFVAIGIGATHYSDDRTSFAPSKFAFDYGAGLKLFATDDIAFRADVRHVLPMNDRYNDLLVSCGIDFYFGGQKKAVVAAKVEEPPAPVVVPVAPVEVVVDSDNDGVPDNLDKCPNTPAGVAVDKDGCPLDSDEDGVPDYLDKCPNTPAGVAVDKDGCPLDSDKDGVPDYLDKCPDTPAGAIVDENGCVHEKVSMTLNVEFDTAKAVIKKRYHNEIKKVADFIKAYPGTNAVIEGHTDNVDIHKEPERNIRLSLDRADSVRQYLIDNFGVDASHITAVGYGPDKPIASNDSVEGRQRNRRVEAVIKAIKIK